MSTTYSQAVFFRVGLNKWLALQPRFPWWATLEIDDDGMALRWMNQQWSIPKASITRLIRVDGILPSGIRIEHSVPRLDPYIVIRSFRFDQLKGELESRGYRVVS